MNNKAVMFSEPPQRCKLIANGKCTMLVFKTHPKLEPPFVGYIYCTNKRAIDNYGGCRPDLYLDLFSKEVVWIDSRFKSVYGCKYLHQKVIGEFVCDRVYEWGDYDGNYSSPYFITPEQLKQTCLTFNEFKQYGRNGKLYGIHISALKIYDTPKELGEFFAHCLKHGDDECVDCPYLRVEPSVTGDDIDTWCGVGNRKPLTRPPQSWCYVEQLSEVRV